MADMDTYIDTDILLMRLLELLQGYQNGEVSRKDVMIIVDTLAALPHPKSYEESA